jgi:hypothetical protein
MLPLIWTAYTLIAIKHTFELICIYVSNDKLYKMFCSKCCVGNEWHNNAAVNTFSANVTEVQIWCNNLLEREREYQT